MPHHLVGSAEIADMLGVSRQYVDRLTRAPHFPEPQVELASGRIWSREEVEDWAREFRKHFCLPVGTQANHHGAETLPCDVCGRVWEWTGSTWTNKIAPLTIEENGRWPVVSPQRRPPSPGIGTCQTPRREGRSAHSST
jgi:predicted DNA-binding transcriptional regulator AlpA